MADEGFGVAGVLRLTAALLRRDAPTLAGLALLLLVLPEAAAETAIFAVSDRVDPGMVDLLQLVPTVVLWFADVAFKGAAISAMVDGTASRPVPLGRALGRGLAAYPGNLGLMVLTTLGITLGSLLVIVPGIIFQCRWLAALPAKLGERRGPRDAMIRSSEMSEGHRGTIFGLLCCYAVSGRVASWISTVPGQETGDAGVWIALVLGALVAVLFAVLSSVGSAAVYLVLLRQEGGAPPAAAVVAAFA